MASEFEFLELLRRKFGKPDKRIVAGIGDDAAIVSRSAGKNMVITTDMLVEDIDFRLQWISPSELGHKALAVSLSDIAAMGAKPIWSMVSIGIPKALWEGDFLNQFYEGWHKLAARYNTSLIGGDISRSPDKLVIDSIVGGEVRKNRAIRRSCAKPGDLIYVSGELGGAAAGLRCLQKNSPRIEAVDSLIKRHLMPEPRCFMGQTLGELKIATAMIDVSDGLSSDLAHLCRESGIGAILYEDKIPIDKDLKMLSFPDELDLALNGGEDFELLFTVPTRLRKDLRNKLEKFPVTMIGEITADTGNIELVGQNGRTRLEPEGFRHF